MEAICRLIEQVYSDFVLGLAADTPKLPESSSKPKGIIRNLLIREMLSNGFG